MYLLQIVHQVRLQHGQIKEIVRNLSGVKDANTTGMLSGVRLHHK